MSVLQKNFLIIRAAKQKGLTEELVSAPSLRVLSKRLCGTIRVVQRKFLHWAIGTWTVVGEKYFPFQRC